MQVGDLVIYRYPEQIGVVIGFIPIHQGQVLAEVQFTDEPESVCIHTDELEVTCK